MVTFAVRQITDHITEFLGRFHERMYLVRGTQRAALIDAGSLDLSRMSSMGGGFGEGGKGGGMRGFDRTQTP